MNKSYVVFCTPDVYRPGARRAIEALKSTHMTDAELIVADNCYDEEFRHPKTMQAYLDYAGSAPVVFLDEDVLIEDPDWLFKLNQCAVDMKACVVGCIHAYPSGEINHTGIMAYKNGTTELMSESLVGNGECQYVPALSSAVMLIADSSAVCFDTQFRKYHHDTDLCISAWKKGLKVVCANNLTVVHQLGGYMRTQDRFRNIFEADAIILKQKWGEFLANGAYEIPELAAYRSSAGGFNWEELYNEASRISETAPEKSKLLFRQISVSCPYRNRQAGACYHLYLLDHDLENLRQCLNLNPHHMLAKKLLEQRA